MIGKTVVRENTYEEIIEKKQNVVFIECYLVINTEVGTIADTAIVDYHLPFAG